MPSISLARIPAYWAEQFGNADAISHDDATIGWRELDRRSNRLARAYAELGVKQDDLVTIALPNGIEFFEACFAVWKLGATPQPVSARAPRIERDGVIALAQPSLVVGIADGSAHAPASVAPGFDAPATISGGELPERSARYLKAMTSGGSTGRPKLIVSLAPASWDPEAPYMHFARGGSLLVPGPLYHNGPFMWSMVGLFKGNHVTVTTRFDAEATLALIERRRVDTIYLVPTMMQRIRNLPPATRQAYDLSSLRCLWHLAAPCPQWLKQEYIDWFGAEVIWELYGGTEAQGFCIIGGHEWLAHRGSVGRPLEGCEMKIVGENGETLAPRQVGEVYMRPASGPGSTYRYVGAEARAIDGGWESLGDMGFMDEEGYLYLADRRTDMIVSGGANIYPAEVEAAIESYAGVRSSAVIGLPHEDLGKAVHAIVDAPNGDVDAAGLRSHLIERLAAYKIPRSFEFVTESLRDEAGKVRRGALREARMVPRSQAQRPPREP